MSQKLLEELLQELEQLRAFKRKYRWHDLRKYPNDLPKEKCMYLVAYELSDGEIVYDILYFIKAKNGFCEYDFERGEWCMFDNVIAWKEIEEIE